MAAQRKLCLIGPEGVGKSILLRKLMDPNFHPHSHNPGPTYGMEAWPIALSNGEVPEVWDIAGCSKRGGLRDGYYMGAQGYVILLGRERTSHNFSKWHAEARRFPAPVVVALDGDAQLDNVPPEVRVVRVDVARGLNLEAPFLALC